MLDENNAQKASRVCFCCVMKIYAFIHMLGCVFKHIRTHVSVCCYYRKDLS